MRRAHLTASGAVTAAPEAVRHEVRRSLQALGFVTEKSAPGHLVVRRGGRLRSAVYLDDRLLVADLISVGSSTQTRVGLAIRPCTPLDVIGSVQVLFDELDDLLHIQQTVWRDVERSLEATMVSAVPTLGVPAESRGHYAAVFHQQNVIRRVAGQLVIEDLGHDLPMQSMLIRTERRRMSLAMDDVLQLLALATFISARDSSLIAEQRESVAMVAYKLWSALARTRPGVSLDPETSRALSLVELQRRIRKSAPWRVAHVCADCRFERITNTAYGSLSRRNAWIRNTIGLAGALVIPSATALTVGARAASMFRLEPEFVCPRCQGLDFDQYPSVICPKCSQLRREPVLDICPAKGCGYDFVRALHLPRPVEHTSEESGRGARERPVHPATGDILTLRDLVEGSGA
jgi:hypothetical protein